MPNFKAMLTGGTGNLGKEILKIDNSILAPNRDEFDIKNYKIMRKYLVENNIKKIIHCAAITDTVFCEKNISETIKTNIQGTLNLIYLCEELKIKLIYISTDYVFDGNKGNYETNDSLNPISKYAKSKTSAELAVRMLDDYIVIRTSFFPLEFPHKAAFADQYTTKDFVDIIAKKVYNVCVSDEVGIFHIGTNKSSVYDKVKRRYPNIEKIKLSDINNIKIPKDVSLI